MKKYYEIVNVVWIHGMGVHGTVEKMGAYASIVKYKKDEVEYEELIENDEFAIIDEIAFEHSEEEN